MRDLLNVALPALLLVLLGVFLVAALFCGGTGLYSIVSAELTRQPVIVDFAQASVGWMRLGMALLAAVGMAVCATGLAVLHRIPAQG